MNPGAIETTGQVAGSAIDALKSTPVVLALVIFNVLYMGGSFYAQIKQNEAYDRGAERWKSVYETALRACPMAPHASYRVQSEESHPVELSPPPGDKPPNGGQ
jgi:hypothetical protein